MMMMAEEEEEEGERRMRGRLAIPFSDPLIWRRQKTTADAPRECLHSER
jgi:hypothetical protein